MSAKELELPHSVPPGGIISIGNFDGVHRGHQQMMASLSKLADEHQTHSVVVTFDPHPVTVLRPGFIKEKLTTATQRVSLLRHYGVDEVVVLPTSTDLLNLTPEGFFQKVIVDFLNARGVVEGPNFCFGKDRTGNVDTLRHLCSAAGLTFDVIQPVMDDELFVSSSRIRDCVRAGQMRTAVELLGHPYQIAGTVVEGARRGRDLGFPTANLSGIEVMLPANGVYAAVSSIDGRRYPTAVSIGPNPTFGDDSIKVECHLSGFEGNLYGQSLVVDLIGEVRPLRNFSDVDELKQQIRQDVDCCISQAHELIG